MKSEASFDLAFWIGWAFWAGLIMALIVFGSCAMTGHSAGQSSQSLYLRLLESGWCFADKKCCEIPGQATWCCFPENEPPVCVPTDKATW